MISKKSIQEVLNVAQVNEVIEDFVNLKRRGANLIGLCPFHDEKTPSFTVSPGKNLYKCFGCGKGGDSTRFLMEHEQMSFPEAIKYLANRYNIVLEETQIEDREKYEEEKKLQDTLYIINEFAESHFTNNLEKHPEAKSYFKERGYLDSTIERFKLGYANRDYTDLLTSATAKGYKKEYLRKLGLISQKEKDFFNDRVMFSIQNLSGKFVAFAGRILRASEKAPKYLNSPESEIYHKRKILYGIFQAKNAIRKADSCIITEGYTDVLSLSQNGVENVVASSGTSLTSEQIRLVKRFTSNVIILYDGDAAGIKAAMRGLDIVLEQDMNVKLVLLPEGEDPDSFIKSKGQAEFNKYVTEKSQDFIHFKTQLLLKESGNDPVKKTELLKDIVSSLSNIRDTIKRSVYIKQCARDLDIYENILIKEVNKSISQKIKMSKLKRDVKQRNQVNQGDIEPPDFNQYHELDDRPQQSIDHTNYLAKKDSDEFQERDLVRVLMTHGNDLISTLNEEEEEISKSVIEYIYENIYNIIDYFENDFYKEILTSAYQKHKSGEDISPQFFVQHHNERIRNLALLFLTTPYEYANWEEKNVYLQTQQMPDNNFKKDTQQAINRILIRKIEHVLRNLEKRISQTPIESEERIILLKAALEIQNQKKDIMKKQGTIGIRRI